MKCKKCGTDWGDNDIFSVCPLCGEMLQVMSVPRKNECFSPPSGEEQFEIEDSVLVRYCENWSPIPKAVCIPENVAVIGECAFQGRDDISSITVPHGVISIEAHAFEDCPNLRLLYVPNTLQYVAPNIVGNEIRWLPGVLSTESGEELLDWPEDWHLIGTEDWEEDESATDDAIAMTLKDLAQLAEQGNTDAMIEISNRIYEEDDHDKVAEAAWWDIHAAEAGSSAGILRSISKCTLLAKICLLPEYNDWDAAQYYAEQTFHWCDVAMKEIQLNQDDLKMVTDSRNDCRYYCGVCLYFLEKYNEAVQMLCDLQQPRAYILYGISMINSDDPDGLEKAFPLLANIEREVTYITSRKTHYEDMILAIAAYALSACYCGGLRGVVKPDLEHSVAVLNLILSNVEYESSKSHLRKELAKYKKKSFGGYKYVG